MTLAAKFRTRRSLHTCISANSVTGSLIFYVVMINRLDGCNSLLLVNLPDTLLLCLYIYTACAERRLQNNTCEGQIQTCHSSAHGASLVAHQSRIQYKHFCSHTSVCLVWDSERLCDLLDCYVPTWRFRFATTYCSVDPWCGPQLEKVHSLMLLRRSGKHSHCGATHAPPLSSLKYY